MINRCRELIYRKTKKNLIFSTSETTRSFGFSNILYLPILLYECSVMVKQSRLVTHRVVFFTTVILSIIDYIIFNDLRVVNCFE